MRLLSFAFLILISTAVFGQVQFETKPLTTELFGALRSCVVDMNGDYLDDVVGVTRNEIAIAYQTESGFEVSKFYQRLDAVPHWSICAGDIDGNGFNDLALGDQDNCSFVMANNNGSDYTEVNKPDYLFSQRTSFIDLNNDGHLDAFICSDDEWNVPFINDGAGNLNVVGSMIDSTATRAGNYTVMWTDYDNDGDIDYYLTKCLQNSEPDDPARINLLYNNNGLGEYTEVGAFANMDDSAQSWVTLFEDFDNDGDFDAFIINHTGEHRLKRNEGDGTFADVIDGSGISAEATFTLEGFSADFDNDGDMDILLDDPNTLYLNNGDMTFVPRQLQLGVGAMGDLNNDGFMDLSSGQQTHLNQGNDNHWLRINTRGRQSNINGYGAKLELYGAWGLMIREVRSSMSWTPMNTIGIHFGLGQHTVVDSLVIKWPSGIRTMHPGLPIDQAITIDELGCPVGLATLQIDGNTSLCANETVTLVAPDGYTYAWSNGSTEKAITVMETGSYNVTMTDDFGCTLISEITDILNQTDTVPIFAPQGLVFCTGTPLQLTVGADGPVTWSNGQTTKSIFTSVEGTYSATVINSCGDTIFTEEVTISEVDSSPPVVMDVVTPPVSTLAIVAETPNADPNNPPLIIWWYEEDGFETIPPISNVLYLSDVDTDTTYWVQSVVSLPGGIECWSERVPVTITIQTTSTDNLSEAYGLKIYPNPSQGEFRISNEKNVRLDAIQMYDTSGREVAYLSGTEINTDRVSMNGHPPGVYYLRIRIGDESTTRKLVITE